MPIKQISDQPSGLVAFGQPGDVYVEFGPFLVNAGEPFEVKCDIIRGTGLYTLFDGSDTYRIDVTAAGGIDVTTPDGTFSFADCLVVEGEKCPVHLIRERDGTLRLKTNDTYRPEVYTYTGDFGLWYMMWSAAVGYSPADAAMQNVRMTGPDRDWLYRLNGPLLQTGSDMVTGQANRTPALTPINGVSSTEDWVALLGDAYGTNTTFGWQFEYVDSLEGPDAGVRMIRTAQAVWEYQYMQSSYVNFDEFSIARGYEWAGNGAAYHPATWFADDYPLLGMSIDVKVDESNPELWFCLYMYREYFDGDSSNAEYDDLYAFYDLRGIKEPMIYFDDEAMYDEPHFARTEVLGNGWVRLHFYQPGTGVRYDVPYPLTDLYPAIYGSVVDVNSDDPWGDWLTQIATSWVVGRAYIGPAESMSSNKPIDAPGPSAIGWINKYDAWDRV